jgi:hypothetical protein
VEKIMNDRPITPVSSEPQDLEALKPNHILLMRQNPSTSAKECGKVESYKARWKQKDGKGIPTDLTRNAEMVGKETQF